MAGDQPDQYTDGFITHAAEFAETFKDACELSFIKTVVLALSIQAFLLLFYAMSGCASLCIIAGLFCWVAQIVKSFLLAFLFCCVVFLFIFSMLTICEDRVHSLLRNKIVAEFYEGEPQYQTVQS